MGVGVRVVEAEHRGQQDGLAVGHDPGECPGEALPEGRVVEGARVRQPRRVVLAGPHLDVDPHVAGLDPSPAGSGGPREVSGHEARLEILEPAQADDHVPRPVDDLAGRHARGHDRGGAHGAHRRGELEVGVRAGGQEGRAHGVRHEGDGRTHGVRPEEGVGVVRSRGRERREGVVGVGDPVGRVAEDVEGALGELQPADALAHEGDGRPGARQAQGSDQAGEAGADDDRVALSCAHRTTSSVGSGRCSTSSVPE